MLPRELVATATVPGHRSELRCYRHDGAYALWLDRTELMSSRVHESEEMLADVALAELGARPAPRVLVGGLGMGFTLARVLAQVPAEARVDVVELVPEIVAWNRELFGHLAGQPLADARVQVTLGDVGDALRAAHAIYDVVLLDVDNGPEALVHPANAGIYANAGLIAAREALRPGGVLGVWSASDVPSFGGRLRGAGFAVTTHATRARGRKGPRRTIWTARKPERA
jgi:spermidine synthase